MADADTLLVEIGVEDLPPGESAPETPPLADRLADGLAEALKEREFECGERRVYWTPRRLAVRIKNVPAKQPERRVERKGPKVEAAFDADGKPTATGLGFAKSCGVPLDEIEREDGRLVHRQNRRGRTLAECLDESLPEVVKRLWVPRRMRWTTEDFEFLRPLRWLCVMHGKEALDVALFGCRSEARSYGHRYHHPGAVALAHADQYEGVLEGARVRADAAGRAAAMADACAKLCEERAGKGDYSACAAACAAEALETEWPDGLCAELPAESLTIPGAIVRQVLRKDYGAVPVRDPVQDSADGDAAPRPEFIVVTDIRIDDKNRETIRRGYERVVRAGLADVRFFYKRDLQRTLESRRPELKEMIFNKYLGTLYDKTERLRKMGAYLADRCGADKDAVVRAAELCKCELVTELVRERPALEGFVGRYYARREKLDAVVTEALDGHWAPRPADTRMPAGAEAKVLALADRLDTLVGILSTGQTPTGNRDPYGLRRVAIAVIRIAIEGELAFDLNEALEKMYGCLPAEAKKADGAETAREYLFKRLPDYYDRQTFVGDDGVARRLGRGALAAVLAANPPTLLDVHKRMTALSGFGGDAAENLINANKRIANILRKQGAGEASAARLVAGSEDAERALHGHWKETAGRIKEAAERGDYESILTHLAGFAAPLEKFFDEVLVMSEDRTERANRLKLLGEVRSLFLSLADFSKLGDASRLRIDEKT